MNPRSTSSPCSVTAGTGKTLLTLAAGLNQTLDQQRYARSS
jgi:predicted ribonuclease YlaK